MPLGDSGVVNVGKHLAGAHHKYLSIIIFGAGVTLQPHSVITRPKRFLGSTAVASSSASSFLQESFDLRLHERIVDSVGSATGCNVGISITLIRPISIMGSAPVWPHIVSMTTNRPEPDKELISFTLSSGCQQ